MSVEARVPEHLIYRDHGGMSLACGHKSDGFIRGTGNAPRYHCPVCRTAERSIYDVQAEQRHRKSGWGGIFRKLRARAKTSPDAALGRFVARELVPLVEQLEGWGWSHGHRDANGWCECSGDDCPDCDRLDRIKKWVLANGDANGQARP